MKKVKCAYNNVCKKSRREVSVSTIKRRTIVEYIRMLRIPWNLSEGASINFRWAIYDHDDDEKKKKKKKKKKAVCRGTAKQSLTTLEKKGDARKKSSSERLSIFPGRVSSEVSLYVASKLSCIYSDSAWPVIWLPPCFCRFLVGPDEDEEEEQEEEYILGLVKESFLHLETWFLLYIKTCRQGCFGSGFSSIVALYALFVVSFS